MFAKSYDEFAVVLCESEGKTSACCVQAGTSTAHPSPPPSLPLLHISLQTHTMTEKFPPAQPRQTVSHPTHSGGDMLAKAKEGRKKVHGVTQSVPLH